MGLNFFDMMNAIYPADEMKTNAVRYGGNIDKMNDNPKTGTINPMRLYFFKIFKEWMTKCDWVSPENAIGFNLNPFINI